MHNASIRELVVNLVKVGLLTKREVIDLEGVVKCMASVIHMHKYVSKGVVADVKVAGDAFCLNKTTDSASMFVFELFLYPVNDQSPFIVLFCPCLS